MRNFSPQFSHRKLIVGIMIFGSTAFAGGSSTQIEGVGNFYQVNKEVYRGAQPSKEGFQNLAKLGVKTIIDLREADSNATAEKKMVEAAGMHFINVPMRGMTTPSDADVQKVLSIFNDSTQGPVFVHCRRGADRTGTVVACYRISHDGWDNTKALKEARTDGMSWIQMAMQHYVLRYHAPASLASVAAPGAIQ